MPDSRSFASRVAAATAAGARRARWMVGRVLVMMRLRRAPAAQPAEVEAPAEPGSALAEGPDRAELVEGSSLFDHAWYAAQVGRSFGRAQAVRHYLAKGWKDGASPHPLFDPAHLREQAEAADVRLPADLPPLVAYLRRRKLRAVPTHPLFDTAWYLAENPAARKHPEGPIGHYVGVGAGAGCQPTPWYAAAVGPDGPRLDRWIAERQSAFAQERRELGVEWGREPLLPVSDFTANNPRLPAVIDHKSGRPAVSVVVTAGQDPDILRRTLGSITAQSMELWELVVITQDDDEEIRQVVTSGIGGADATFVARRSRTRADVLAEALEHCQGTYVAWITAGEEWVDHRLRRAIAWAQRHEAAGAYDGIRQGGRKGKPAYADTPVRERHIRAGRLLDLTRVVVSTEAARAAGGFDPTQLGRAEADLASRLVLRDELVHLPVVGVERATHDVAKAVTKSPRFRPFPDHERFESWGDRVLNAAIPTWDAPPPGEPDTVSIVIPTYDDWRMTTLAVESVLAARASLQVQVIVWNNGCDAPTSVLLDSLALRYEHVEVHHSPVNLGFALGCNSGAQHARGDRIVFLNNDCTVTPGWLEPLVEATQDPAVLGSQSLLLFPSGTVQSAGVVFPAVGGLPYELLRGHPAEDVSGADELPLRAATGAALCVRRADFFALRGFDATFRNGMEDVDLCLRLAEERPGSFRVVTASRVIHHESQTPGRFAKSIDNRAIFVERWADSSPRDDVDLYATLGFEITGHQVRAAVTTNRRLCQLEPSVRRAERIQEATPRLRWAIKNPAPAGAEGEKWGDTHFARCLARALQELGQEVVIDCHDAFYRPTAHLDDVAVAIRGNTSFWSAPAQVNLGWVISHPEMLSRSEAGSYDQLFVASTTWPRWLEEHWGIASRTLLQATDPELFDPDRGTPDTGHPVLFVGGSRRIDRPIVRHAISAGAQVAIFGSEWEGIVPARLIQGQHVPYDQVGIAYRSAGIVLNDHWDSMREDGFVSNRLFDAVAAGARVVSDPVAGIEDIFGRSVLQVSSEVEMAGVLAHNDLHAVFGDDHERRDVAARVRREHSFLARAQTMLDTALELRAKRSIS